MVTPKQARDKLARQGKAVTAWAREHRVSIVVARHVLNGRCKGLRGEGHKVAVLLGIKDGVIE